MQHACSTTATFDPIRLSPNHAFMNSRKDVILDCVTSRLDPRKLLNELKTHKKLGLVALAVWVANEIVIDPLTSYALARTLGYSNLFPLLIPFVHTELITIPVLTRIFTLSRRFR